jgi:hypothetical protein
VIKGNSSAVLAINDRGVAVGVSTYGDSGLWTAAIWRDGVVEDLNQITSSPPGTHLEMAFAINNKGEMLVPQGQPRKQKSR